MRRTPASSSDAVLRIGVAGAGAAFLASAAIAGRLAFEHMSLLAGICGTSAPHCGWCAATIALAVAGLGGLAWAARPAATAAKVRA